MKKTNLWLAGGLLASLAVYPLAALADDGAGAPPPDDGTMQGPPPDGQGPMGGGKWLDTMKDKLGLSDSQVGQIKKNMEDQKNTLKPIREDIRTQTKALAEKLKAGAKDQDLKPILDKLDQDRQKLADARQKNMESMRGILTPTQQAKAYLGMVKHRMEMGKKGHRHRGMGHEGPEATPSAS